MIEGAFSLPEALRPPKNRVLEWHAFIERNRRTHRLVDKRLCEAVARLREADVEPVLLKGQAYARQYPDAVLRQCGDIDLYVGEDDYAAACATARRQGWEERPGENGQFRAKHYGCYLRGVHIELHRVAAQFLSPVTDRRFGNWSRAQLLSNVSKVNIGGCDVSQPGPLFDVVFVFLHLFHHFVGAGIGLRQLCDWVMLLHAHAGAIDRGELRRCLKKFGIWKGWLMMGPVAVEHLGLPETEFPFYTARYRSRAEKILDVIMSEGNFGWYDPGKTARPDGYWRGKLHSLDFYRKRMAKLMPVVPRQATVVFLNSVGKGCRQIIIDRLTRRKW